MAGDVEHLGVSAAPATPATPRGEDDDARLLFQRLSVVSRASMGASEVMTNRLDTRMLEALLRQNPKLLRGIKKQSGDALQQGFRLVKPGTKEEHPKNAAFLAWVRKVELMPKLEETMVAAHLHGDGLLEKEFVGMGRSNEAPSPSARVLDVHTIDPTYVRFQPFRLEDGKTSHMLVQEVPGEDRVELHPARYEHLRLTSLPGYKHGLSTVEAAFHAALAEVKGVQGIGEIVYHSGVPKLHGPIENPMPGEVQSVLKMLLSPDFQRAIVWNKRLDLKQLNPQVFDPKHFFMVLEECIAAAIGLPVMVLKGAQAGQVSGSETNLEDYRSDLAHLQSTRLSPIVASLAAGVLGLDRASFEVAWNPFPESAEKKARAAKDTAIAFAELRAAGVKPLAAARIVGLDIKEEDLEVLKPGLPPGGGELAPEDEVEEPEVPA